MGRSFRENLYEPARWSAMSGRMANPAPNTVAEWCDGLAEQNLGQSSSSIEKSTAKTNEQLNRTFAPEEVNTLVKALEIDVQASRNRLGDHQEKFENLSKERKSV